MAEPTRPEYQGSSPLKAKLNARKHGKKFSPPLDKQVRDAASQAADEADNDYDVNTVVATQLKRVERDGQTAMEFESRSVQQLPDKQLKKELAKRFDELNALWKKAEDQLRAYMVPTEVSFDTKRTRIYLPNSNEVAGEQVDAIGWVKHNGAWRLCYSSTFYGDGDEDVEWKPIVDCSLDVRRDCVKDFYMLLSLVQQQAQETIHELDAAIAKLKTALSE